MFDKRIALLNSRQPDDWYAILKRNYDNYEKYDELSRGAHHDAARKKLQALLPAYLEVIRQVNRLYIEQNQLPDFESKPYDVGIYLVGHSLMPIILSLAEIKPRSVELVYTEDTHWMVPEIKKALDSLGQVYPEERWKPYPLTDLSDPAQVYQDINQRLDAYQGQRIAIDITGGKKTMVAGAFLASAHSRSCDIFYIDFEEYDPGRREPVYNTEFLAHLPNPSEIFSLTDWERLQSLFDNFQYGQALKELARIEKNMAENRQYFEDPTISRVTSLKKYAQAYECWDDYRYREAYEYLSGDEALEKLRKTENLATQAMYQNKELFAYYVLDRLHNACRRQSQGHLQGAFLRLITLIEFTLMTWFENDQSDIFNQLKGARRYVPFSKVVDWLKKNSDPIIPPNICSRLFQLGEKRNQHILIHSTKLIQFQEVKGAEEITWTIIENILKATDVDIANIYGQLTFKKFQEVAA